MSRSKPKLKSFRIQARNANRHTGAGLSALENSIATDGWIGAMTVAADNETFDGSARLETAIAVLGSDVDPIVIDSDGSRPVIVRRTDIANADDPKAKKLAIAANRIAQIDLDWDPEILAEINKEIDLGDLWDEDELLALLSGAGAIAGTREEDEGKIADLIEQAESGEIETRVKAGEIWQLGRHRLLCGDSTNEINVDQLIGSTKIAMVWSDPPYGLNLGREGEGTRVGNSYYIAIANDGNTDCAKKAIHLCRRFADAVQVWWGGNYFAEALPPSRCWIVWDKQDGKSVTFADCELAWTSLDKPARIFKHLWDGFRRDSERGECRTHINQKPVALAEWFFEAYGSAADVIFDPFIGSGISFLAAERMGRSVIGIEINPVFCEVAIRRWEAMTGKTATRVEDHGN